MHIFFQGKGKMTQEICEVQFTLIYNFVILGEFALSAFIF
jgi:hypothetical protein